MKLPGLPTFAALMLAAVLTAWLGIWGPIFSVEFKGLNDSAGVAAWAQAGIAGLAIVVVYLAATIPIRAEAADRATERRLRADGLKLLIISDILVLKGEIETCIHRGNIYEPPIEPSATLMSKTDQLYLLGETGGRLLQTIGIVNGVAAQSRRYQAAATTNGVPTNSKRAAGVMIWNNNVKSYRLCLMNLDEAIKAINGGNV
jgi:hypothetical protein